MVSLGEHPAVEVGGGGGHVPARVHLGEVVVVLHGLVVEPDTLLEGGGLKYAFQAMLCYRNDMWASAAGRAAKRGRG